MLLRLAVAQVSRRDNIGASFGLVECAAFFVGILVHDSFPMSFLNQLIMLAVLLFLLTFVSYKVREKWNAIGGTSELIEPLHIRGA